MKTLANQVKTTLAPRSKAVESFLNSFLPKREPREVYGVIREFVFRGGKRLRAALVMLGAGIGGGSEQRAVPLAAAIELFHAFTLIHDDIMDESELRRGKPCLHRMEGIPLAMNAGDVLGMLVMPALFKLSCNVQKLQALQKILWNELLKVFEGQAMELTWIRDNRFDISEKDYFIMVEKKTAVLIATSAMLGAWLSSGSKKIQQALYKFGQFAGIAFQIRDDILNLIGDEEKYRKEIGGDITEGKRSLVTIHALNNGSGLQRERLKKILSMHTRDERLIREAIDIVQIVGSVEYAQKMVERYTKRAFAQLQKLPRSKAREQLGILAKFLLTREQ